MAQTGRSSAAHALLEPVSGAPDPREELMSSGFSECLEPGRWRRCLNLLDSAAHRALGQGSDEEFVEAIYRRWLGRPPDGEGAFNCLSQLRSGTTRRALLSKFVSSSPEAGAAGPRLRFMRTLESGRTPRDPRTRAAALPEEVWLELTTRCNMAPACSMCGLVQRDPAAGRDMEPRVWGRLLPLLRASRTVGLHGAGGGRRGSRST